ncbi:MAG: pantoate--beta-alanine ligase [Nocardioides sp.]|nr:pantoate--beta-alanine ligase [Nocardioides sp.]
MSALVLAHTRAELAGLLAGPRAEGHRVGLVPTMGALHEGHASLMHLARRHAGDGPVVVSIFVNPLQFAPGEDLDRYPRTLPDDLEVCARAGVDVVFAPRVGEMYPHGVPGAVDDASVTVAPGPVGAILEGRTRPTHFRGVLTVVAKLFGLVRPDVAVFGEKDYQQLVLVRRMAGDLCLGVEVVGAETQREPDGVARSSRNRFLDPEQRQQAQTRSRSLYAAQRAAAYGVGPALAAARAELGTATSLELDYLVITTPELGELPDDVPAGTEARVLIEARLGATRLIDNLPVTIGSAPTPAPTPDNTRIATPTTTGGTHR